VDVFISRDFFLIRRSDNEAQPQTIAEEALSVFFLASRPSVVAIVNSVTCPGEFDDLTFIQDTVKEDDATFKKVGKMLKRMSFKHKHSRTGSEYYVIRNSAVTTP